ncbi:hypothetical protein [Roseiflexus sp.]|jgi:hypothetical protein
MANPSSEDAAMLRLLECWMPLAQELNQTEKWGDDSAALERLIRLAAPVLTAVDHVQSARAILMVYHAIARKEPL